MVQPLLGHGEANQTAAILGHEIDQFRRDFFGGEGQIAFVFAIFIVHHDDHTAGANLLDGGRDVGECRLWRHHSAIVANALPQEIVTESSTAPREAAAKRKAAVWAAHNSYSCVAKEWIRSRIPRPQARAPECTSNSCCAEPTPAAASNASIGPARVCTR